MTDQLPEVTMYSKPKGSADIVVLDLVDEVPEPSYCIHGKATCVRCDRWVWLGSGSIEVVTTHRAYPLCQPCAIEIVVPGVAVPMGNVADHKRADGPHD